jgi:hypothetical protein
MFPHRVESILVLMERIFAEYFDLLAVAGAGHRGAR